MFVTTADADIEANQQLIDNLSSEQFSETSTAEGPNSGSNSSKYNINCNKLCNIFDFKNDEQITYS